MIFDAAFKKLHVSKKAIQEKNIEKAHTELTKVQKIFTELMVALDLDKGGELASNLLRIYDFVYHHLVKANIKQDIGMIDEVIPIVENLRSGWTEAVDKYMQEQAPQQTKNENAAARFQQVASNPPASDSKPKPKPQPAPSKMQPAFAGAGASSSSDGERPRLNLQG